MNQKPADAADEHDVVEIERRALLGAERAFLRAGLQGEPREGRDTGDDRHLASLGRLEKRLVRAFPGNPQTVGFSERQGKFPGLKVDLVAWFGLRERLGRGVGR